MLLKLERYIFYSRQKWIGDLIWTRSDFKNSMRENEKNDQTRKSERIMSVEQAKKTGRTRI